MFFTPGKPRQMKKLVTGTHSQMNSNYGNIKTAKATSALRTTAATAIGVKGATPNYPIVSTIFDEVVSTAPSVTIAPFSTPSPHPPTLPMPSTFSGLSTLPRSPDVLRSKPESQPDSPAERAELVAVEHAKHLARVSEFDAKLDAEREAEIRNKSEHDFWKSDCDSECMSGFLDDVYDRAYDHELAALQEQFFGCQEERAREYADKCEAKEIADQEVRRTACRETVFKAKVTRLRETEDAIRAKYLKLYHDVRRSEVKELTQVQSKYLNSMSEFETWLKIEESTWYWTEFQHPTQSRIEYDPEYSGDEKIAVQHMAPGYYYCENGVLDRAWRKFEFTYKSWRSSIRQFPDDL